MQTIQVKSEVELEICFTCFGTTGERLRIVENIGVNEDNRAAIFAQHFWLTKDEYYNRIVCSSCWQQISDFHQFYRQVEMLHPQPGPTEIQLEALPGETDNCHDWTSQLGANDEWGVATTGMAPDVHSSTLNNAFYHIPNPEHSSKYQPAEELIIPEPEPAQVTVKIEKRSESEIHIWDQCEANSGASSSNHSDTDSDSEIPLAELQEKSRSTEPLLQLDISCYDCHLKNPETDEIYPSYQQVSKHSFEVHGKTKPAMFCRKCGRRHFSEQAFEHRHGIHGSLRAHFIRQKQIKCNMCPKNFSSEKLLKDHLEWHKEVQQKNHYCSVCDLVFLSDEKLLEHVDDRHGPFSYHRQLLAELSKERKHSRSQRASEQDDLIRKYVTLKCEHCEHVPETFSKLVKHHKSVHKSLKFAVICCQRRFHIRYMLYGHCLTHEDPNHFKCKLCGFVCTTKDTLRAHTKAIHRPVSERPFKCSICNIAFLKNYRLKAHMEVHRMKEARQNRFVCKICKGEFDLKRYLKIHMKSSHECQVCHKKFLSRPLLLAHTKSHTEEELHAKKFQCKMCKKWLSKRYEEKHQKHCAAAKKAMLSSIDSSAVKRKPQTD